MCDQPRNRTRRGSSRRISAPSHVARALCHAASAPRLSHPDRNGVVRGRTTMRRKMLWGFLALVKVLSRAAEFDPGRDALSWALGIGAYECRTLRKKQARRREDLGAAPADAVPATSTPEDAAIDGDLQAAAAAVFGALRPADSETLLAAARGQREKSSLFRKRLERALSRFRKEWRARHGEE